MKLRPKRSAGPGRGWERKNTIESLPGSFDRNPRCLLSSERTKSSEIPHVRRAKRPTVSGGVVQILREPCKKHRAAMFRQLTVPYPGRRDGLVQCARTGADKSDGVGDGNDRERFEEVLKYVITDKLDVVESIACMISV